VSYDLNAQRIFDEDAELAVNWRNTRIVVPPARAAKK
jgi:hypothetical protein